MSNIKIINHISLQYYIKHKIVTNTYLVRTHQTPKLYIYLKTKIQLQFKNRSKISLGIEVKLVPLSKFNNITTKGVQMRLPGVARPIS